MISTYSHSTMGQDMTVKTRQVAFITGGARGIGFEIAAKLAQAGFDIALNDYQDSAALQASVARLKAGALTPLPCPATWRISACTTGCWRGRSMSWGR